MWVIVETTYSGKNTIYGPYSNHCEAKVHMDKKVMQYISQFNFEISYYTPSDNLYLISHYIENMTFKNGINYKNVVVKFEILEINSYN